jgi:hypothetical protein
MLIFSYVIKLISTNMNKILHKLFYVLFGLYNTNNTYYLIKYRMNLRFIFYESLQVGC